MVRWFGWMVSGGFLCGFVGKLVQKSSKETPLVHKIVSQSRWNFSNATKNMGLQETKCHHWFGMCMSLLWFGFSCMKKVSMNCLGCCDDGCWIHGCCFLVGSFEMDGGGVWQGFSQNC